MKIETKEGLDRYAQRSISPGGFLYAVLSNDLFETIGRADEDNLRDLFEICSYVYNNMPSDCHGSPEKVDNWLQRRIHKG